MNALNTQAIEVATAQASDAPVVALDALDLTAICGGGGMDLIQ